jgi:hypothetical protein
MGDYCRGLTAHVIHSTLRYTQWVSDRRVPAIRRAARVRQPAHGLPLRIDGALYVTICSDTPPCKIRHTCLGCILTGRGVHTHTHLPVGCAIVCTHSVHLTWSGPCMRVGGAGQTVLLQRLRAHDGGQAVRYTQTDSTLALLEMHSSVECTRVSPGSRLQSEGVLLISSETGSSMISQ